MSWIARLFGKKNTPAAKAPEPIEDAQPQLAPQAWLTELFQRHGLASTVHDDWVLPNGELPAIRGFWHPGETHGRLDVEVLVGNDVLIEERFAGLGAGEAGLTDGLQNFTVNSFHTLLSALWSRHDPDQVLIESWTVAGRPFNAFIGNVGTRSSNSAAPTLPAELMPKLEAAIRSEPLGRDLHWFRFFVANVKGEFTYEALRDNEPWTAGLDALASCGWRPRDSFYSARMFIVLRAAADEVPSAA